MAAVASRTVSTLTSILRDGRVLSYRHDTRVDVRAGRYEFDCSGMIDWVLAQSAPVARRESRARTHGARPLAADYARLFLATSSQPRRTNPRGWARVERVQDAMPGDVLAWIRPRIVQSNNTGHVVFVMAPPEAIPGEPDAWLVRIADSSRYTHQDDTREGLGRTGLGVGTLLVIADPVTGAPRAYGWFGARTPREWVLQTQIAIARPVR
ncbi:MAG: hypothetical protein Q8Q09_18950 [Deltaproteobacteria bacterium]|nr:hypothetical protein [Deltaproteobacteria bacterium]